MRVAGTIIKFIGTGLPTTLSTPETDGGVGVELRFVRELVWPDGRVEIEGVTPKLPAPEPDETKAIEP